MAAAWSSTRLTRMHDVLAGHVAHGGVPGIVTLVSRHGETHVDVHGTMAADDATPMRRDAIFRISSMSKPVVAAAALILVEECRLRLDEPLDRLLPELANRQVLTSLDATLEDTVPALRPITLRDLLTFRLGFGALFDSPEKYPILAAAMERGVATGPPAPASMPTPDEYMRRLGELPLMHQPGEKWMYNTGSDVLGVLIARVSGQPLEVFLRERLFEPLGMVDTGFSVPGEKIDRLATSYMRLPDDSVQLYDRPDGQWSSPPPFPSGAGGLVSTIDDYLAFADMLLSDGKSILSRASVELMTTDQLTPAQKAISGFSPDFFSALGWGFGVAVVTARNDLAASPGRYGWDGGLGTTWWNDPAEGLIGLMMTQVAQYPQISKVYLDFWTTLYQAIGD